MSGPNEGLLSDSDRDSLHTIPLSIIPLKTPALQRARLIKNNRLESVVELFKEESTGSGQLEIDDLDKVFNWPVDHPDMAIMQQLSALPSYDVYSLRMQLRRLNIPINDSSALTLSERKRQQLHRYMTSFTKPLIINIFSDDDHDIRTIDDIYALFSDANVSRARDKLNIIARKLEIELVELPKFLDDYGDIYMSLCYYKHCMDVVAPSIGDLMNSLESVRTSWQLRQDDRLMQTCDFVENGLNELAAQVTGWLESFERNSKDLWDNLSAERFRKIETLVRSYHIGLGAYLCTLSVKMETWRHQFPNKNPSPGRVAEFISADMKQGLENIQKVEATFSQL